MGHYVTTDPFEQDALRDAREQLYMSAHRLMRLGVSRDQWLSLAPLVLNRVPAREVAAIVALVWGDA